MRTFTIAYLATLLTFTALAIAGGIVLVSRSGPSSEAEAAGGRYAFNFTAWELRHLPEKWLYDVGSLFSDHKDGQGEDEIIRSYFALVGEIQSLERSGDDPDRLQAAVEERRDLENVVEDIIEGRVTDIVRAEGLTIGPPPFTDMQTVFPPVDFEMDAPPRVLVVSPRDEIIRDDSYVLRPGMELATVEEIEADVEEQDGVSALVVQTGGVATYPSNVSSTRDYLGLVDTVFHEWLHQYLVMFPLGRDYFAERDARILNESVANIAGRALAEVYFQRYGYAVDLPKGPPGPAQLQGFDFESEMRTLRAQVDELLADGEIEEAEALMNERRDHFEEQGVYIRRINQAYFAFHGSYTDTPASNDPIGPGLETLLEKTGSPGEFIRVARSITSRADIDEALDSASGG